MRLFVRLICGDVAIALSPRFCILWLMVEFTERNGHIVCVRVCVRLQFILLGQEKLFKGLFILENAIERLNTDYRPVVLKAYSRFFMSRHLGNVDYPATEDCVHITARCTRAG